MINPFLKLLPNHFYFKAPSLCGIPEFSKHRTLILDCWAIYHHINFQNKDIDVSFDFFPLWENSSDVIFHYYSIFLYVGIERYSFEIFFQFKFNLYFEVKRLSPDDEPLTEMNEDKRLWIQAEDMSFEIYKEHLRTTIFNTDIKILNTQHYVPEYLKGILSKKLGKCGFNY